MRFPFLSAALGLLAVSAPGCSTLGYLLQAGRGQLAIMNRARPVEEVLRDERTPPGVRRLLSEIPAVKRFGEEHGLKRSSSYTEYVKLDREATVWVVSACEPLEFKSRSWGFPVVGSFTYLGWFDREGADRFGDKLRAEGLDVDIRGAAAYSTLGWFRDPVYSPMLSKNGRAFGDLVNTVLHETVHETVYIDGQSTFNESVASFIGDHLTLAYLERGPGRGSDEYTAYVKAEERSGRIRKRLFEAYGELDRLYASGLGEQEKLGRKAELLSALGTELGFKREINNATLIQFKTYATGTEGFSELLDACGGDWRRFVGAVNAMTEDDFGGEQVKELLPVIRRVAARGCAAPAS